MNDCNIAPNKDGKLAWVKPELVILEQGASDIEFGGGPSLDGVSPFTTS